MCKLENVQMCKCVNVQIESRYKGIYTILN